jgi:hypothetical protein
MSIDEPKGQFTFSCEHCGHAFDASPPDQIFTLASARPCMVCDVLNLGRYIERNFECDNCHKMTRMYWHVRMAHTELERIKADREFPTFLARQIGK